jgi:hypothetical protein
MLGAFYYTLGNLHPKLRQQTSNIQLLALVKSSLIKKHAMYVILKHVLKDFKILEQVYNIVFVMAFVIISVGCKLLSNQSSIEGMCHCIFS